MSRHRAMANLDYNEELSDAEADDGPLDDGVDEVAMREGTDRVIEILGDRAQLIAQSQIEQALWDSYYDADKAAEALSDIYAEEAVRMNDAVVEVLQRLAEKSDKVTPKQIQDALWHYYYDIDKTVGYLDRTYINPPEKPKPKPKAPTESGKQKAATPAQRKVPKGTVAAPANGNVEAAAEELGKLNVKAEPRPKSKQIDVIEEYGKAKHDKKSASFVVVGHVDAGKSTLMGRLLLELKFVEKNVVDRYRRQAEKIGKQSFALAWVMDQREEERDRGVTIDIATNHFETEKTRYTILDAPGHKDFIPNMIAGTSQADFAILVVDASTGAFEKGLKGQTREHVLLLRALGVHRLIVAVNKMDQVGWAKARFDEISEQVTGFLSAKGFLAKNTNFIPISGYNGDNLTRKSETPEASWYTGATLISALDSSDAAPRSLRKPFRMAISEIWKSPLGQITVSGRIDTGTTQIGDAFIVQPSGEDAYVKSIMVDADLRDWAVAGENVSIFLTGIDVAHLRVGDIISAGSAPIACSDTFKMKAMAFEHVMPMPIDLHRGRLHSAGQIAEMEAVLDKATGEIVKRRPKVIRPGEVARVMVKLGAKIPLEAGQRVVIRSSGETVAAGLIE